MLWLAYLMVGAFSGFVAGLFGVGGGTVIVPMLMILLPQSGIPAEQVMTVALGTSFAVITLTAISSARQHHRLGNVNTSVLKIFVPSLMVSVFVMGWVATFLPKAILVKMFAVMMLFLSVKMLVSKQPEPNQEIKSLSAKTQVTAGLVIGSLSSFAGIGGGTFIVPFLNARGFELKKAIGTSSACSILLALAATISFMLSGQKLENMPDYSIGFVYFPAFFGVACMSIFSSKWGAIVANRLPVPILKKAFAMFLCLVAIVMFFK